MCQRVALEGRHDISSASVYGGDIRALTKVVAESRCSKCVQWVNLALRVTRASPYIQGTFCVLPQGRVEGKK